MAVGTALSRATGLLRVVATDYAVGLAGLASAYNVANTAPNMVIDLVLGGVLSATFVPVFVERFTRLAEEEAWRAISAVVSVALIAIGVAALAFLGAAPLIAHILLGAGSGPQAAAQRLLATDLLLLFAPQLAAYGFIALATALLNARHHFSAPMFVPIANNLLVIAVLVAFRLVTGPSPSLTQLHHDTWAVLLLGLGTTAGVVVQAWLLIPYLRRVGLRLHWNLAWRHEAVRAVVRLSGWTFGLVAANQIALGVVLVMSDRIGPGAPAAYVYSYTFFQLPYGIVAVSVMSATAPDLARHWALGRLDALAQRAAQGLRATLAVVIPIAAGMVIVSHLLAMVLERIAGQGGSAAVGDELAMLGLGIPGFCAFLFGVRVLQSMQDLRTAFWLYLLENGINIVLAVVLAGPLKVRGIGLSISIAYTVAAIVTWVVLARRLGGSRSDLWAAPLARVVLSSVVLGAVAAGGASVISGDSLGSLIIRLVCATGAGAISYLASVAVLGMAAERRKSRRRLERGKLAAAKRPDAGGAKLR